MQNEYYQLAALIVASSIALYVIYITLRSILSYLSNNPALVCANSFICFLIGCIGLVWPDNPMLFANIALMIISLVVCLYSAVSYNTKRGEV